MYNFKISVKIHKSKIPVNTHNFIFPCPESYSNANCVTIMKLGKRI